MIYNRAIIINFFLIFYIHKFLKLKKKIKDIKLEINNDILLNFRYYIN